MKKTGNCFAAVCVMCVLALGGSAMISVSPVSADELPEVQVVDLLDVKRFMGTWYLIAGIPSWFERQCASGQTAEYTLRDDGTVKVVNSCYRGNERQTSRTGRAFVADEETFAKLEVSFLRFLGLWPFRGDYWVVELGDDFDYGYVVVGHPTRDYGWIMSRDCYLDADILEGIFERLEDQFYEIDRFEMIDQTLNDCP